MRDTGELIWAESFLGDSKVSVAGRELSLATIAIVSVVAIIALAVAWIWDGKREARLAASEWAPPEEIDPFEGGYPVPPLPGQRLREPGVALTAGPAPTTVTTSEEDSHV